MSSSPPAASFSLESLQTRTLSSETAWSLAQASQLANRSEAERGGTLVEWGFTAGEVFDSGPARGFLAAAGDVILLAFGPEELPSEWPGGGVATVDHSRGGVHATAHAAFAPAADLLRTALRIVHGPGKVFWITGHGLGGAAAILAAAEMDGEFPVAGIYTFNPTCAGKIPFAEWFDATFLGRSFRFEANGDQTFSVPPGFRQVQLLVRLDLAEAPEAEDAEADPTSGSMERCLARLQAQAETERLKRLEGEATPRRGTPPPQAAPEESH